MKAIIISIFLLSLTLSAIAAETYEKVSNDIVKITNTVDQTVTIADLKARLRAIKDRRDSDIRVIRYQQEIDKIQFQIDEAKRVGVQES
jgi:ATP-dependent Zn protease